MKSVHPLYQKRNRYFLPKKLKSQKLTKILNTVRNTHCFIISLKRYIKIDASHFNQIDT